MDLSQLREEQPEFCRTTIERAERFTEDLHSRIILGKPQDEFEKPYIELNAYSTSFFDTYHIQTTFHADGSVYLSYVAGGSRVARARAENSKQELAWEDFVHRSPDGREEVAKNEYSWLPKTLIHDAGYFLYCIRWKIGIDPDDKMIYLGAAPNRKDIADYHLGFRVTAEGIEATLGANHRSA